LNIVVDSSVLIAALLDTGAHGAWAERILADGTLHAPELVRAQAANILRRLERTASITAPEANGAFEDLMLLELNLFAFEPFADRIWELRHNVTSYDAWYVALAEALQLPLATLDDRLSRSNGVACEFLLPAEI
jgi:predicted nucleic acid-binding protein